MENVHKNLTIQTGHRAVLPIICFRNNPLFVFRVEHHHGGSSRLWFMCPENIDAISFVRRLRLRIPALYIKWSLEGQWDATQVTITFLHKSSEENLIGAQNENMFREWCNFAFRRALHLSCMCTTAQFHIGNQYFFVCAVRARWMHFYSTGSVSLIMPTCRMRSKGITMEVVSFVYTIVATSVKVQ